MAISILFNPMPVRLFEADGDFAAGAKAYFYLARTTTPLSVYTDAPLMTAHPWPVVADAYGLLPPIYIEKGEEYKVRIEDALGSILYAADGISNPPAASTDSGGGDGGIVVTEDQVFQTGFFDWSPASTVRAGWVRCNGRTISKLAGTGTEDNDDDCEDLFKFFWNNFPDSMCPVTPGGRGANAQADWDIAKSIATLDMRGRSAVGLDDMGNTAANLIQVATTINTTNASTTVAVASTDRLASGMFVLAAGVPAGTRINGVLSATSFVLTAPATATATAVPARFSVFTDAQVGGAPGGENTHTLLLTEGANKEQFFDLSGLTMQDIEVPNWAVQCQLIGGVFVGANLAVAMRISMDGTTFLAGASDYFNFGPSHDTGSNLYQTTPATGASQFVFGAVGDNATFPHLFTAEFVVRRINTSINLAFKTNTKASHSSATANWRTSWIGGYVTPATGTQVKSLRIMPTGGAFVSNSHLHVRWLGVTEFIPASSARALPRTSDAAGAVAMSGSPGPDVPGEPSLLVAPELFAAGQSMAMNIHTPARLGSWFAKK